MRMDSMHTTLMLLPFLGLMAGALGTLVGTGGGFLLMPILLMLYPGDSPASLTAISLAVSCLNALAGTVSYARMGGRILYRAGLWFAAACVPGAWLGALATYGVPAGRFRVVFALFLLALSIALFRRPPTGRGRPEESGAGLSQRALGLGSGLSLGVGFLSSFLGIGGGILHVPILAGLLKVPVHQATATLVHGTGGWLGASLPRIAALGAGVLIGAPLGARLSTRVRAGFIIRLLALALCLASLRLAFEGVPAFFLESGGTSP